MAGRRDKSAEILLIEDNNDDATLARLAFEKVGLGESLLVLNDAESAMNYLGNEPPFQDREFFPLPSLIVLDLKMPGISGAEFLKWLRAQPFGAKLPVVVLSHSSFPADISQAYSLGISSFLIKPINNQQFVEAVAQLKSYCFEGVQLPTTLPFIPRAEVISLPLD